MRLLASLLLAVPLFAQTGRFDSVQIKITPLSGPVHLVEGSGGNIVVSAAADGVLMVDTQFAELAPKIKQALQALSPKPVRIVVNTHLHNDHIGGNAAFSDTATIVAHSNVRRRLSGDGEGGSGSSGGTPPKVEPRPEPFLPKVIFDHELVIPYAGEQIRLIHLPAAHTDGDILLYFPKSKVVHMGDVFVRYGFPFIDLNNGGSVKGMIQAIETALALLPPDAKVIPGHGAPATLDDMRVFLTMIKETSSAVSRALAAGKTIGDMKRENLLEPWKKWSGQFIDSDRWLATLVNSLQSRQ